MKYYITKLKLQLLDRIAKSSARAHIWSRGEADMIRLGIHKNEKTKEISIKNMKKLWKNLLERMGKSEHRGDVCFSADPVLENIRSSDAAKVEIDVKRLERVEKYSENFIKQLEQFNNEK